jgi:hypothetical protein
LLFASPEAGAELPGLIIMDRFNDFFFRVHDERTVRDDRLRYRLRVAEQYQSIGSCFNLDTIRIVIQFNQVVCLCASGRDVDFTAYNVQKNIPAAWRRQVRMAVG